jgi:hypothetical protein
MSDPLGLSIGTTNVVAACNGSLPVTRRAVLTLYPHRAPKIGLPEEDPILAEPGMLISGFVERIGDSVALVSSDGSAHDPDLLMVEALDSMVLAAGADAGASEISIAVPAYWKPRSVQALRNALRTHVGFVRSGMAPRLVSDAVAGLRAVNSEVGIPADGVVGLLDFGGGGTSVTLLDTKGDFEPVSHTLRCAEFSGEEVDQALLLHVYDVIGRSRDHDAAGTAAIGQLGQLKDECRAAKERLSFDAITELQVDLPGFNSSLQVTRDQLEHLIQDRLTGLIYAFDEMLARRKWGWADLAAVVTVGGGASIPLVNQRLSLHTRRPVLTLSKPELAAALGALLLAARSDQPSLQARTSVGLSVAAAGGDIIEVPAGDVLVIDADALTDRELAWSQTEFPGDVPMRFAGDSYNEDGPGGFSMRLNVLEQPKVRPRPRIRLSQVVIATCAVVAMTSIGGVAYTLAGIENREAPTVPTVAPIQIPAPPPSAAPSLVPSPPPVLPAPPPSAAPVPTTIAPPPPAPVPSTVAPPPPPVVVTRPPPPPVLTTTTVLPTTRPPVTTTPRATPTTTPPQLTTTTSPPPPPPPTTPVATPTTTVPMTTEWIRVPLLPVPIPVPVPANQAPQNQVPQDRWQQNPGYQNPYQSPGY